jgi:hypothetical protein
MRLVRDAEQQMILVYELVAPPDEREPSVLVFEFGAANVRIERYPSDWRTLPDADLLAIGVS